MKAALRDALRRSDRVDGAGLTRPWIQDFSLGQPVYGAAEVRAQIQATYDVGIQEWILWNPSTRYTLEALEPNGGFEEEPLVRVAGVLAPVSRRQLVIDSVAALPVVEEPDDTLVGPAAVDTFPAGSGSAAAPTDPVPVDSTGPAPADSIVPAPVDSIVPAPADSIVPAPADSIVPDTSTVDRGT